MTTKALIIGGSGGIGQAIVKEFQAKGHLVVSTCRHDMDLLENENISRFFKKTAPQFDIVIFAAGQNVIQPCDEINNCVLRQTLQINLQSFVELMFYLVPYMRQKQYGRIVAIASIFGSLSRVGRLSYTISKHGLIGAVKNYAIELAPYNILVNSVSPGYIETKLTFKNNSPEQIEQLKTQIPIRQLGKPEHIAKLVSFLCSEENQYLTGQDIIIDGGFSINGFKDKELS